MNPSFSILGHRPFPALAGAALLVLLWAALAPLREPSHERNFTFPRMQDGQRSLALPRELRLTLGVQDVLLLRNLDRKPHVFGPLQLRPGQEVRLPFEQAGTFPYACPDVAGGTLLVHVVPLPDPGWERLRWRLGGFGQALRTLPLVSPQD
ncbi:cupredoxin domain-containing protein [Massilia niabensis]|uniref:EfeO-type cupredoxin-like domain-containing protein n=1 Tax=Massilia niabensis TaxID=544910 RepID=A0ABW0L728_9BURK